MEFNFIVSFNFIGRFSLYRLNCSFDFVVGLSPNLELNECFQIKEYERSTPVAQAIQSTLLINLHDRTVDINKYS